VIPQAPVSGRRIPTRLAVATVAILLAGFGLVFLIHVLLSSRAGSPLALLIAIGWTAACAVATSLGSRHRVGGLLLTALGLAVTLWQWGWLEDHVDAVYLIQHAGMHAVLGIWFGGSLLAARNGTGLALISRLATRLHGPLPEPILRYTIVVTGVWTGYFLLMAATSCALFVFGSLHAWSILANLVTLPLTVAIFIVEYLVRLRLHPDFEHVSIIEGVRAFMK
jgi:uncharacterized membrane protein